MLTILLLLAGTGYAQNYVPYVPSEENTKLAGKIVEVTKKNYKEKVKFKHVLAIVEVSEQLGESCIPGVFKKEDFISLAFVESLFNPYEIGADKEVGTWQILEWRHEMERLQATNPFDVNTNGDMMCNVLRSKYKKYGSYKMAIRAYNGLGAIDKWLYYNKVQKFKKTMWPELFKKPQVTKKKVQQVSSK